MEQSLAGYQTAIRLWTHEAAQNWSRFNMLLVVNSILIAVLGLTLTESSLMVATLVIGVVGMVVGAVWFLLTRRSFAWQAFYRKSAQEIEENQLGGAVTLLARGEEFDDGEAVALTLGGEAEQVRMGALASVITAELGAQIIIGIFLALYVIFALLTAIQMARQVF